MRSWTPRSRTVKAICQAVESPDEPLPLIPCVLGLPEPGGEGNLLGSESQAPTITARFAGGCLPALSLRTRFPSLIALHEFICGNSIPQIALNDWRGVRSRSRGLRQRATPLISTGLANSEKPTGEVGVKFIGDALTGGGERRQRLTPGHGIMRGFQDIAATQNNILHHLHPAHADADRGNERRRGDDDSRSSSLQHDGSDPSPQYAP